MVTEIYIKQEHRDSELLRLRKGMDGCGCSECQDFYQLIDLSVYGDRVKRYSDVITIIADRTGADLYDDQRDHWTKNDSIFICDGQGYAVAKNGATVCIGPVDDDGNPLEDVSNAPEKRQGVVEPVTKPPLDEMVKADDIYTDVTATIRSMAAEGKSTREIAVVLESQGIKISHMTVSRRLQGVLI